jgi:hypothetical protein
MKVFQWYQDHNKVHHGSGDLNMTNKIDFKVIYAAENSSKFQKTRFWKEKSVEKVVTLECLPFNSSRRNCDVPFVLLERSCNGI